MITEYDSLDERNLKFCKRLNLRNSSINKINATHFHYLELIDISYSKIQHADFRSCKSLQKVITDVSQEVLVCDGVDLVVDNISSANALLDI